MEYGSVCDRSDISSYIRFIDVISINTILREYGPSLAFHNVKGKNAVPILEKAYEWRRGE